MAGRGKLRTGATVIRQAISCDICGAEKRQTNHWFVAYEHGAELRLSGWSSRHRSRPETKHLCGQTCMHKLVVDFMARAVAVRPQPAEAEAPAASSAAIDSSLTSKAAHPASEPPRFPPASTVRQPQNRTQAASRTQPALVTTPARSESPQLAVPLDEPSRYASRDWRAEAWEREREREQRAKGRRPEMVSRLRG
jgi:hypothetical protein